MNEAVKQTVCVTINLCCRVNQNLLKWFGHSTEHFLSFNASAKKNNKEVCGCENHCFELSIFRQVTFSESGAFCAN